MKIGNSEVKRKDILPLILVIICGIIFLWAMFISKVIVNKEIFENSWNNYLVATLAIVLIIRMEYDLRTNENFFESLKKTNTSKIKIYLIILIFIPLLGKMFTDRALMVVLHTIVDKQAISKTEYIKDIREGGGYRDFCYNRIELVGYDMLINGGYVCGVSKKAIKRLKKGQKIILYGDKSYFGFTPKSFSYDEEGKKLKP
ncbi:MAG: hypothetical protein GY932_07865 [Arcobacter sp.]|nr:hypothetical protein [Arcobacter sp.]